MNGHTALDLIPRVSVEETADTVNFIENGEDKCQGKGIEYLIS